MWILVSVLHNYIYIFCHFLTDLSSWEKSVPDLRRAGKRKQKRKDSFLVCVCLHMCVCVSLCYLTCWAILQKCIINVILFSVQTVLNYLNTHLQFIPIITNTSLIILCVFTQESELKYARFTQLAVLAACPASSHTEIKSWHNFIRVCVRVDSFVVRTDRVA